MKTQEKPAQKERTKERRIQPERYPLTVFKNEHKIILTKYSNSG
jgi:hypothetical protein